MTLLDDLREDVVVLQRDAINPRRPLVAGLTNRGVAALALHRAALRLRARRVPALPLVLTRLAQHRYGVDIDLRAKLAPGVTIVHGYGLVIGANSVVGHGCTLFHGVTLGNRLSKAVGSMRTDGCPTLEADVVVCAGAKILGPVTVGAGSVIVANAVVTEDVPARSVVVGNPGRVVRSIR
jgi:serine O-acetyltransferase